MPMTPFIGRADLMAHHRQERALGLAGPLGRLLGLPQFLRRCFCSVMSTTVVISCVAPAARLAEIAD